MAPNSKVVNACKAMKSYGIPEETVKPVLKTLLDLYDKNWKLIEDENYRVLVDAIFDCDNSKREEIDELEECEPPLKKSRLRRQTDHQSSLSLSESSQGFSKSTLITQHMLEAQVSQTYSQQKMCESIPQYLGGEEMEPKTISASEHDKGKWKKPHSPCTASGQTMLSQPFSIGRKAEYDHLSPQTHVKDSGEASVSLQIEPREKTLTYRRRTHVVSGKEPEIMPGTNLFPKKNVIEEYHNDATIPQSKPFADDLPNFEVPLAMIPQVLLDESGSSHGHCSDAKNNGLESPELIDLDAEDTIPPSETCEDGFSKGNCSNFEENYLEFLDSKHVDTEDKEDGVSGSSQFDIASSPKGEVKISLICNSSLLYDKCVRSLDAVLKQMEEKYIKIYQITEPGFSLLKLLKDMCEFLTEGIISSGDKQDRPTNAPPNLDVLKKSHLQEVLESRIDHQGTFCIQSSLSEGSVKFKNFVEVVPQIPRFQALNGVNIFQCIIGLNVNGNGFGQRSTKTKALEGLGSYSNNVVIVQKNHSSQNLLNSSYYVDDITRGEEKYKISLVNEISNECQPNFKYTPKNIPFQNAYVKFPFARISDEDVCPNCFGDCLSLELPCACAGETGGEFAYSPGGLVKGEFLEKCILMSQNPQQDNLFYCKDCPLERSRDKGLSDTCKGHLVRKFIKECWYKCGCTLECGNRVVQRGITVQLQVFMTPEGKGWGLRTLENLPKGAFVCEYVGEIVTNMELFERNSQNNGNEKHTYPVLLDADWGSEAVLKDEEALCLDATFYGNVARFINHRCSDANLVEIPVEVETPDHHYYHLAFFTRRKVNALEELTWDYGIDFDDDSHPVRAFQCQCGSKFCRDMKHRKRTRSRSEGLSNEQPS